MTISTHTKSLVIGLIASLAVAAPAGAAVLEPAAATLPDTQQSQSSERLYTTNSPSQVTQSSQPVYTTNSPSTTGSPSLVLHRDGSKATPFVAQVGPEATPVANDDNEFNWGDAAIGAGAVLFAAALLGLGLTAERSRRRSPQPSGAISQGV